MTPSEWKSHGKELELDGHKWFVAHHDKKDAPVMVLLHGFPTSSLDWYKIWEGLGAHFTLVAPDFLGYGWSDKPFPFAYSINQQADGVGKILEQLGIDQFHLLAHDYGNTVAQEMLARQKDGITAYQIESILFLNGGLFPEKHRPRRIQKLLVGPLGSILARFMTKRRFAQNMERVFGQEFPPQSADIDAFWSLIVRQKGKRCIPLHLGYMAERDTNRERWVPPILADDLPVALINGPEDPVSGRHMAKYFTKLKPGADVTYIKGVGHYPQIEAPDMVLQAILSFHDL